MSLMPFDRYYALSRLGFLTEREIDDTTIGGRKHLIVRLDFALKREAKNARDGHWTYSPARHKNMLAAYKAEVASVQALEDENAAVAA
jgi:hypothetical protein